MTPGGLIVFLAAVLGLLCAPRRWVLVPLLVGCIYLLKSQGFEVGGIMLRSQHLLLAAGVCRVIFKSEKLQGRLLLADKLVMAWGVWVLFASFFHEQTNGSGFVYSLGSVFSIVATYFLTRIWCRDFAEVRLAVAFIAVCLVPVALGMVAEKAGITNPFTIIGSTTETIMRDGIIRSRGPYRHPILAGTVGAAFFPLMFAIWREQKTLALTGLLTCLTIVGMCHASGPLLSFMFGVFLMIGWRYRHLAGKATRWAIFGYLLIEVISNRPAYHAIVTRLDMTGSSTAYYRARLIDTTVAHFNEWWLFGTDRTVHWIPSGIGSRILESKHMDITNYYVAFGVNGGLLSMLLIITLVVVAIRGLVLFSMDRESSAPPADQFAGWCLAAGLGVMALSGVSVAFFDQSSGVIWIMLALATSFASNIQQYSDVREEDYYGDGSSEADDPYEDTDRDDGAEEDREEGAGGRTPQPGLFGTAARPYAS